MNTIDITPIVNAALALIGAGVSVLAEYRKKGEQNRGKEAKPWMLSR